MIFNKAFTVRKEETPANPIQATADESITLKNLVEAFGLSDVPRNKLSEATYFACLRTLSESLGKLPLRLIRSTAEHGTVAQTQHPLYGVLRNRPNPFTTATEFWTMMELQRNHYGNAYARIDDSGDRVKLWNLPSEQVSVWWDKSLLLSQTPHIWYRWCAPNGKRRIFSDEEIIHVHTWLSFDGITGLSVQDILRYTIDGNLKSQNVMNKLYDSNLTGKVAVNYTGDLNEDLEKTYMKHLQEFLNGTTEDTGNFIPVPMTMKLEPLNAKLTDSQFLELRRYTALQVAAAFGIKPDQINDYTKSSYASSEAQNISFLVDTLQWIIGNYEQELSYKLLTEREQIEGYSSRFNPGVMLRTTTDKQVDSLSKGVANAIYMPNEARNHLDMPATPEGNKLYAANGSVIPLEMAGQQYKTKGGKTDGQQNS